MRDHTDAFLLDTDDGLAPGDVVILVPPAIKAGDMVTAG